jgi:hypothetical protein
MADSYNELFGLGTWSKDTAMQGWWRLQETTGTTAVDSSGKGRNGTLVNFGTNPVTTAGPNSWLPSTYRFNGSNHRVDLGDYRSDFSNAVTVLAFLRATASKVFPMAFSAARAGGDGNEGFELRGGNSNNLMQFNVDEATGRPSPSSITSTLNVWSHIAGTYNGSTVILYDDGVSVSTAGSGNIAFGAAGSTWRIGDRGGGVGLPWQGDICDVALFSRALTAAEVGEHRFGPEPLNTVAPVVSGSTSVGSVLTATNGSWNAQSNGTLSYTYQWTRNGVSISGATASTYTTVSGDVGAAIRCRVRGVNDGGFDAAQDTVSNAIAVAGGTSFKSAWAVGSNVLVGV